jgi:S-DNA-T family DNA segregation ATPase FtsK/SpoIIIE
VERIRSGRNSAAQSNRDRLRVKFGIRADGVPRLDALPHSSGALTKPFLSDYRRARSAEASLPELPSLLDMFVQIGRIGRSLGVDLLLAARRLDEGRLRGLDTQGRERADGTVPLGLRFFGIFKNSGDAREPGHGEDAASGETLLDILVDRLDGRGAPAHRVWPPRRSDSR